MKPILTALGMLSLGLGLFSALARLTNPSFVELLDDLRERLGDTAAQVVYALLFVALPTLIGLALLTLGLVVLR